MKNPAIPNQGEPADNTVVCKNPGCTFRAPLSKTFKFCPNCGQPFDSAKVKNELNIGRCALPMIFIPGDPENNIEPFYISETPVTINQYKEISNPDADLLSFLNDFCLSEYKDFTILRAYATKTLKILLGNIRPSLKFHLPTKEQWLHVARTHSEKIIWCHDCEFIGVLKYYAIDWEVVDYEANGMMCLLGLYTMPDGNKIIRGSNFTEDEARDNIAFRLVCTESEIKSNLKETVHV